jgi:hypothetical protein
MENIKLSSKNLKPELLIVGLLKNFHSGLCAGITSPPPGCNNVDPYFLSDNFVAKVFGIKIIYKIEKKAQMIIKIKNLDPKRLWSVQMVDYCSFYMKILNKKQRSLNQKRFFYRENYQIIYPKANTLSELINISTQDIYRGLSTILFFMKSLGRFNDLGYHHDDLHELNLMYSVKKGLIMAIDFGYIYGKILNLKYLLSTENENIYKGKEFCGNVTFTPTEYQILDKLIARILKGKSIELEDLRNEEVDPNIKRHIFLDELFNDQKGPQSFVEKNYMHQLYRLFCDRYIKSPGDTVQTLMKKKPSKKDILADTMYFGRHSKLFEELIPEVKIYYQTRDPTGIFKLMDTPFVRKRYNSFALGHILFAYLAYFYQRLPDNRDLLSIFLKVICNEMIQDDVYQRLSITESFEKILFETRNKFPDFYEYYINFDDYTENNGKSFFGTMTQKEIQKEYEVDRILLERYFRKQKKRENFQEHEINNIEIRNNNSNNILRQDREIRNMEREERRQRHLNNVLRQDREIRNMEREERRQRHLNNVLRQDREIRNMEREERRQRLLNENMIEQQEESQIIDCRGLTERDCRSRDDCLFVNKQRKYCRKRGCPGRKRIEREINILLFPCKGKSVNECGQIENCIWRRESRGPKRTIKAHCRKVYKRSSRS